LIKKAALPPSIETTDRPPHFITHFSSEYHRNSLRDISDNHIFKSFTTHYLLTLSLSTYHMNISILPPHLMEPQYLFSRLQEASLSSWNGKNAY